MSMLIVSGDHAAATALCAALERHSQVVHWTTELGAARELLRSEAPLVVLADDDTDASFFGDIFRQSPWTRVRKMSAHAAGEPSVIRKPFDAEELAVLLGREQQLARADQARFALQHELERAERLANVGRLSASMAHEINNPLAVLSFGVTHVLEAAERNQDDELAECAHDMELAVERIRGFVAHIAGYVRREPPTLRDESIARAIDVALRMVRPRARQRGVEIRVEGDSTARAIHDASRLSQAILNLVANGVDAAAAGGKSVCLEIVSVPNELLIQVDDDGPGIPPEIAGQLFQAFATTKAPGQGTGLGLAITRQIVTDHHGSVSLGARPEGGTRAELRIPALCPACHRILIVDPDAALRRALGRDLRREGFNVAFAGSAQETAAEVGACSVIVSELDLPDETGTRLLERLRESQPKLGRILLTTEQSKNSAAHRVIAKPWNRVELVEAVRALAARHE